jgi:uncharacterized protein (DUF433 family)
MSYQDIITIEPGKRGGKPCIRGMRIMVYDVLEYLASGMSQEEILEDFPYLTRADILACLSYAADREKKIVQIPIKQAMDLVLEELQKSPVPKDTPEKDKSGKDKTSEEKQSPKTSSSNSTSEKEGDHGS